MIPTDIREIYGKREEIPTWPATLTQTQAKAEFAAWLQGVEDRIGTLRASNDGVAIDLTERQAPALAGR
ncbi:hypothetical protein [Rhizorhapis suberifaciens]|uniref:Uncharacterized protein n=1 Tax=Rhizorhapis suberifaciens TaxID=13656 RepID=A0A840HVU4_9SPHN|nr:hypothetical protein [Rhizorhapis suberifaciens]MBB4642175.1 hypothetical protein [Rhizorhapis suberifaciens]